MIETPQIVTTPVQPVASLHLRIPSAEMRHAMGPGIQEAMAAAQTQGVGPTGPWFAHHREITAELFDFEICVPVRTPVHAVGRVRPWTRPAIDVVRTVYHGPYEGLRDAWHAFDAWIAAHGVHAASDLYERYVIGPESTPEVALYETELSRPVLSAHRPAHE